MTRFISVQAFCSNFRNKIHGGETLAETKGLKSVMGEPALLSVNVVFDGSTLNSVVRSADIITKYQIKKYIHMI